jgi:hypothetical protein
MIVYDKTSLGNPLVEEAFFTRLLKVINKEQYAMTVK